ncbi:MAG: diguanylate cyclase/phosphodiesterase (GGDEF & EAL domains) with PAS/PAC sensor(s), partial [uncultured Thermomicrobiales bacterium]
CTPGRSTWPRGCRASPARHGCAPRLSTTICWRKNAFSATSSGMLRVRSASVPRIISGAAGLVAVERQSRTAR